MLIKLRFRFPEIIFRDTSGGCDFCNGGYYWSSQRPFAQSDGAPKTSQPGQQQQQQEAWWERALDPIAVFTLALGVVAGAQLGFFYWQLRLIRESLEDAKTAASAATAVANAANSTAIAARSKSTSQKLEFLIWSGLISMPDHVRLSLVLLSIHHPRKDIFSKVIQWKF
jgi:hypothetical protein